VVKKQDSSFLTGETSFFRGAISSERGTAL